MRFALLLLVGCGTDAVRGNVAEAELTVCSPDGGSQVLVASSPDGFPEGAVLEDGCATLELTPGTWFVRVTDLNCESPWDEVVVEAPVTEHTVDFEGCLG